jgi:hypothetical protein
VLDNYQIDRRELDGWLFCACPKLAKLAELKGRIRSVGPLERKIRKSIARRKPNLVAFDPFVKTHALEESNIGDMDFVCSSMVGLAESAVARMLHLRGARNFLKRGGVMTPRACVMPF